jgi:membrane protein DedA with SNARE-associated domain
VRQQEPVRRPKIADGMRRDEELFARYGPAKALALARFIAVVRSLLNPLASALHTPVRTFTLWQVVCGTSGPTAVNGQFVLPAGGQELSPLVAR